MPPVVSIVGKSESGKTTFLVKLIAELTKRGYRVATIKHSHHSIEFDHPKKDSWRHAEAGSSAAVVSSTSSVAIIRRLPKEPTIDEIVHMLGEDFDIVLTEGFSRGDAPKIEVHRKATGKLLKKATRLVAVVTDEPVEKNVRQFDLEDYKGIADLLEEGFIRPNNDRVTLFVNKKQIVLTEFPRQIIANMLLAMASSLKGVKGAKFLEFFYRKELK